jgi:hypothetical protein
VALDCAEALPALAHASSTESAPTSNCDPGVSKLLILIGGSSVLPFNVSSWRSGRKLALLRRGLPADDDGVVTAMHGLAHARYRAGKPVQAESLHREALALRRKRHVKPDSAVAAVRFTSRHS